MSDFSFEIKEKVCVLSTNANGWSKEFNIVSFNGGTPKYDIRDWSPDHKKMSKGTTLTKEEAERFSAAVAQMYFEEKEKNAEENKEEEKKTDSKVIAFKPKAPKVEQKKEKTEVKKTVKVSNMGEIKLPF